MVELKGGTVQEAEEGEESTQDRPISIAMAAAAATCRQRIGTKTAAKNQ